MMRHLAVRGLFAVFLIWFALQRAAGNAGAPPYGDEAPACDCCSLRYDGCSTPTGPESAR